MNLDSSHQKINNNQLRQLGGALAINTIMDELGWPDDHILRADPHEIEGLVMMSYYDGHGRPQNVPCDAKRLALWLTSPPRKNRAQLLKLLDKKRTQDDEA